MTTLHRAERVVLAALLAGGTIVLEVTAVAEPQAPAGPPTAELAEPAESAELDSFPGPSELDCAGRVAQRVQAHYEQIADFEADFEQSTQSVALGSGSAGSEVARGKVIMAKPGKMRWEYAEPQESWVLSDGVNLWIYDVVAGEAQHLVASGGYLSGAALQFLMGRGVIAEDFVVTSGKCTSELAVVELELTPRAPASYERLGLRVDPRSGEVKSTTLVDLFGNRTTISFHSVRVNRSPDPGLFRFDAPPGVDVIELTPTTE